MSLLNSCCFSSVSLDGGLNWAACPKCGKPFAFSGAFTAVKNALTVSAPDYNAKVIFACPMCRARISLFAAVHRFDAANFPLRVQRSDAEGAGGIPANWWVHH